MFAGLTVAQNIELGAYLRRPGEAQAEREGVLRQFPGAGRRGRAAFAGNLSGGQQQMLAIARGLMGKPALLILDEPSLGLAPALVEEVFELIARLREAGIAILLSEQNARMSLRHRRPRRGDRERAGGAGGGGDRAAALRRRWRRDIWDWRAGRRAAGWTRRARAGWWRKSGGRRGQAD